MCICDTFYFMENCNSRSILREYCHSLDTIFVCVFLSTHCLYKYIARARYFVVGKFDFLYIVVCKILNVRHFRGKKNRTHIYTHSAFEHTCERQP